MSTERIVAPAAWGIDRGFFEAIGMPRELIGRIQRASITWDNNDFARLHVEFSCPEIVARQRSGDPA